MYAEFVLENKAMKLAPPDPKLYHRERNLFRLMQWLEKIYSR